MPARVEIRPFLRRHLDRILVIEHASFPREPYPRELFLELLEECAGWFFVARRARRIVGYSVTAPAKKRAEIVSLAVLPKHRRSGIATALVRYTLARLRRAGVHSVGLTVRTDNLEAIRLYRRLGFRSFRRIARYYEDCSDGLEMRMRL